MSLVCPHNVEVVGGKVKCDVCFPPRTVGKRKVCTSKAAICQSQNWVDGKVIRTVLPGVHVECNKKAKHKGLHRGVYEGQTFHWRG